MDHNTLELKGTFLGQGGTREVYSYGSKLVIKVPRVVGEYGYLGLDANEHEANMFRAHVRRPDKDGVVRAWCKLLSNGWLVMERVIPIHYPDKPPYWSIRVDCGQVGRAVRDGIIVAYDYGI